MKHYITTPRRIITLLLMVFAPSLAAEQGSQEPKIAIGGYSPVSYFTRDIAERGSPAFAVEYDNKIYHLTSEEQVQTFQENPQQFIPLFAEFCPYSLTLGRQVGIDPTNFKIIAGKLLLFHNSKELDGLARWNDHNNDQELLDKANQEYLKVRF
ncbi:MAG: YHS domain-containing (seleno)protein [Gammaproteobacteria bacterium]